MNINSVTLLGNLTRDPELTWLKSGVPVTEFGLATNRSWKDKAGDYQQQTEFHQIKVFGRQAQPCAEHLNKGQQALVQGRLHTNTWEAEDGSKRSRTEIIANRVQFGRKSQSGTTETADDESDAETAVAATAKDSDDEIPF